MKKWWPLSWLPALLPCRPVCRSPTCPIPTEGTFLRGSEIKAVILKDFIRFDPHYVAHRQRLGDRLDSLAKRLAALQTDWQ